MWSDFFIGLAVGMVFLFLPGTLVARSVMRSLPDAFASAPAVSLALYSCLTLLYAAIGVGCSWVNTLVPCVCIGAICLAVRYLLDKRWAEGKSSANRAAIGWNDWGLLGGYLFFGLVFTGYVFVKCLDGPVAIFPEVDTVFHLGKLRAFSDSGIWSSLQGSFYPSAWHALGAMVINALSVETPLATNVLCTLFIACVFSSGMFLLLKTLFPQKRGLLWFGAICSFAFAAFPWKLLTWGLVCPYIASLCLVPAVAALFIQSTGTGISRKHRACLLVLLFAEIIGVTFTHTGAVFVLVVFLAPYCISAILHAPKLKSAASRRLCACGFALFTLAAWAVLFKSPFFAGLISFDWPAYLSKSQALANILLLSFKETKAQILLGALVLIGIGYSLAKGENRWLVASYAIACIMYFFDISTDGNLKHFLTGFWYTDQSRVSANTALMAIPLACMGMFAVYQWLVALAQKNRLLSQAKGKAVLGCTIACVFSAICFYPSFDIPGYFSIDTAFGSLRRSIATQYSNNETSIYSRAEREFVEQTKEVIPSDAKVINIPMDGSVYMSGVNGVSTVYNGYLDIPKEGTAKGIVRTRLYDIASDSEVRDAVRSLSAKYVILLDDGSESKSSMYLTYKPEDWAGIESIDENTPGFQLLLSDGDMRLYEILDAESE